MRTRNEQYRNGGITDMDDLKANLAENCVPVEFMNMDIFDYRAG